MTPCVPLSALLPLLVVFGAASIRPASANGNCTSAEECVPLKLCQVTDDSGRGHLGPRIDRPCGYTGFVCCDRAQLESATKFQTGDYKPCTGKGKCVPYYNCIEMSGDSNAILDVRTDSCDPYHVCCEADQYKEKVFQPCGQNRKCVPHNLCNSGQAGSDPMDVCKDLLDTCCDEQNIYSEVYKSCGLGMECVPRILCNDTINDSGKFLLKPRVDSKQPHQCESLEECCLIDEKSPTNVFITRFSDFEHKGCGYRNEIGLVVDLVGFKDNEAEFGEFPWVVSIMTGRSAYICTGSLISPSLVLTAAHCVHNYKADTLLVRAGEWDTNTVNEPLPHVNRRIQLVIVHQEFDKDALFNDIALLVTSTPFKWTAHIQPICLPPPNQSFDRKRCYATGWGSHSYGNSSENQVILKKVELPIVPHEQCQQDFRKTILGKRFRLRPSFICAGGEHGKDVCKGDGGAPLMCAAPNQPNRYMIAGIVSWGLSCGVEGVPGAYANVPYLRNWIDDVLASKNLKTNDYIIDSNVS